MARVTTEDGLEKVGNRFLLCHLATKRARQLLKGAPATIESTNKACVTALREVAESRVHFVEDVALLELQNISDDEPDE